MAKTTQTKAQRASTDMRGRSGMANDDRPLVSLLYVLMRDGDVSPGRIEEVLLQEPTPPRTAEFSNGWLAAYAQDVADRLVPR